MRGAAVTLAGRGDGTNQNARLDVEYVDSGGAPSALFRKFPPSRERQRELVRRSGMGQREVAFYGYLGVRVPLPVSGLLCRRARSGIGRTSCVSVRRPSMDVISNPYGEPRGESDAKTAWAIVEQSGRSRAGIMIDSWHFERTRTSIEDLRSIAGARILGTQLSDALAEPMEGVIEETLHHRLLPGEGAIGLLSLLSI